MDKNRQLLEILQKHATYSNPPEEYQTEYILGGKVPAILEKYGYAAYMEGKDPSDDRTVFAILNFVCDSFGHNGFCGMSKNTDIESIVKFCEENEGKTNCRGLAILLASLLRLNGIKARHIICLPYEDPCDDCHVVVDCLLPSGHRVMLDPSFRLFYRDSAGEYVSLQRLRQMIINGEELIENKDAAYNGNPIDTEYNLNYMTKNTFRFARSTAYCNGSHSASRRLELLPQNYRPESYPKELEKDFVYNEEAFWKM